MCSPLRQARLRWNRFRRTRFRGTASRLEVGRFLAALFQPSTQFRTFFSKPESGLVFHLLDAKHPVGGAWPPHRKSALISGFSPSPLRGRRYLSCSQGVSTLCARKRSRAVFSAPPD